MKNYKEEAKKIINSNLPNKEELLINLHKEQSSSSNTNNYAAGGALTVFDGGFKHDDPDPQNKYGGIPQGTGANGMPNLVEEGETKLNSDNYVFSDSLKLDKETVEQFNLDKSFVGKTFADASKKIDRPNSRRENDSIEETAKKKELTLLMGAQEEFKQKEVQKKLEEIQSLDPNFLSQFMGQGQAPQEPSAEEQMMQQSQGSPEEQMMQDPSMQEQGAPMSPEEEAMMQQQMRQQGQAGGMPPQQMPGMKYGGKMFAEGGYLGLFTGGEGYENLSPEDVEKAQKKEASLMGGINMAGNAVSNTLRTFNTTNDAKTDAGNAMYQAGMGAVSKAGPIGGVIGAVAAVGDAIGAPIKNSLEKTNEQGDLQKGGGNIKSGFVVGSLFNPYKTLTHAMATGEWSPKQYLAGTKKRAKINALGENWNEIQTNEEGIPMDPNFNSFQQGLPAVNKYGGYMYDNGGLLGVDPKKVTELPEVTVTAPTSDPNQIPNPKYNDQLAEYNAAMASLKNSAQYKGKAIAQTDPLWNQWKTSSTGLTLKNLYNSTAGNSLFYPEYLPPQKYIANSAPPAKTGGGDARYYLNPHTGDRLDPNVYGRPTADMPGVWKDNDYVVAQGADMVNLKYQYQNREKLAEQARMKEHYDNAAHNLTPEEKIQWEAYKKKNPMGTKFNEFYDSIHPDKKISNTAPINVQNPYSFKTGGFMGNANVLRNGSSDPIYNFTKFLANKLKTEPENFTYKEKENQFSKVNTNQDPINPVTNLKETPYETFAKNLPAGYNLYQGIWGKEMKTPGKNELYTPLNFYKTDVSESINAANQTFADFQKAARNASPGAGSYLSNMQQASLARNAALAQAYQNVSNTNNQMRTQVEAQNSKGKAAAALQDYQLKAASAAAKQNYLQEGFKQIKESSDANRANKVATAYANMHGNGDFSIETSNFLNEFSKIKKTNPTLAKEILKKISE